MPGVRRDLQPFLGVGIVIHVRQTVRVHHAQVERRVRVATLRSRAVPPGGLFEILLHPLAVEVCLGKAGLGIGVAPFGRRPHPPDALRGVTRDPITVTVHESDQELRLGHPLPRGREVPLRRLEGVLSDPVLTKAVHDPKPQLCLGNAPPGEEADLRIGPLPGSPFSAFPALLATFSFAGHGCAAASGM